MKEDLQVRRNKRIRGEILQLLNAVTPGTVQLSTIARALIDGGYITTSDIAPYVDYLVDRGYITMIGEEESRKIFKDVFPASTFLKITSRGTDIIEHTVEDLGVDV